MLFLKRLFRFFWPTPAQLWDMQADSMRLEGYAERQIVDYLGPRPQGDA